MLQQWRLEAHWFIEGNGRWDIWLHDGELDEAGCAALIPESILTRVCCSQEGAVTSWRGMAQSVCPAAVKMCPTLRAFTLVRRSCRSPALANETQSEIAPKPHLEVLSGCYSCGSTQSIRRSFEVVEFSPKEYWAGGGNRKMILILNYTESLALLTVAYCFLPQSSAQSLSGRGYSVSHFTANSFTSVDVDCRGLHHLLHSHWHGRNAEQKQGEGTGLSCTWEGTALTCQSALRAWGLLNLILYL